jgi:hypothetical protein
MFSQARHAARVVRQGTVISESMRGGRHRSARRQSIAQIVGSRTAPDDPEEGIFALMVGQVA